MGDKNVPVPESRAARPLPTGRVLPIQQFDPLKPLEMRAGPPTVMRPRTWSEATRDLTQRIYEALAQQPLGRVSDALGVTKLAREAQAFDQPMDRRAR